MIRSPIRSPIRSAVSSVFERRASGGAAYEEPADMTMVYDASLALAVGIPLTVSGAITIDWGDATTSAAVSGQNDHTYAAPGIYTVTLTGAGSVTAIYTGTFDKTRNLALTRVESFGGQPLTRITFLGAHSLVHVPRVLPSSVTNLIEVFKECTSLNSINVMFWNTANVTRFDEAFKTASVFNSPLPWNTSAAVNMQRMLGEATAFDQNLSSWNTGLVTDFADFARDATAFRGLGLEGWDVHSALGMAQFAQNAVNFNPNLSQWCVANIPSVPANFAGPSLAPEHYPVWGTCPGAPIIVLSSTSIAEDAVSGSTVGALSVDNSIDSFTFTVTADPDNKFTISGSNLVTDAALDYETANTHSVTLQADNGVDAPLTRTFLITVTDVADGASAPVVVSRVASVSAAANTQTWDPTLPTTTIGNRILVIASIDANATAAIDTGFSGANWTIHGQLQSGTACVLVVMSKVAEASNALRITVAPESQQYSAVSFDISGSNSVGVGFVAQPTALVNANPPSYDAGTSAPTLWIAACSVDGQINIDAAPSGYSNFTYQNGASAAGPSIGTAEKVSTAQVEDPGTFTSGNRPWVAATLAVR